VSTTGRLQGPTLFDSLRRIYHGRWQLSAAAIGGMADRWRPFSDISGGELIASEQ